MFTVTLSITESLKQLSLCAIQLPSKTPAAIRLWSIRLTGCNHLIFFAGSCLGWSRAERPSVSWTEVLKTLCLQQPKEMFNIDNLCKSVQMATSTEVLTKFKQNKQRRRVSRRYTKEGSNDPKEGTHAIVTRCNRKTRALVKPEGSTYAREGRCNRRKRALVKPEGSTYAGARSDHRIPRKERFEHISRLVAIKMENPPYAR